MPAIETSPQIYARTAGASYLLVILFGAYSEGVNVGKWQERLRENAAARAK